MANLSQTNTQITVPSLAGSLPQTATSGMDGMNPSSEEDGEGGWADFSGTAVPTSSRTSEPNQAIASTVSIEKPKDAIADAFGELFDGPSGNTMNAIMPASSTENEVETKVDNAKNYDDDGFDDFADFDEKKPEENKQTSAEEDFASIF